MKSDDPVGRGTNFVSHDSSDGNIFFLVQTDGNYEDTKHTYQKNELKSLEEKNRIIHKNILFYFILFFLVGFL